MIAMDDPRPLQGHATVPPNEPKLSDVRRRMIDETTRLMAAGMLADKRFPRANLLPCVAPRPGWHPGHCLLVDYRQLAFLLWGSALRIRNSAQRVYLDEVLASIGLIVVGIVSVALTIDSGASGWIGLVFVVTLIVCRRHFRATIAERCADIRAAGIEALLRGENPPSLRTGAEVLGNATWTPYGDGRLDRGALPVLFTTDKSRRFPSYGTLFTEQVFLCRPNQDVTHTMTGGQLSRVIEEGLSRVASGMRFAEVTVGHVVVVDGRAVARDSPWIDAHGRPRLDYPRTDGLEEAELLDPSAPTRVYTAIEVLLPEHISSATCFVRTFMVGNSAACELCICILGPPRWTWGFIRERLYKHRMKKPWSQRVRAAIAEVILSATPRTPRGTRMTAVRRWAVANEDPFVEPQAASSLRKLDPLDPTEAKEIAREIGRLQSTTRLWAGRHLAERSWREANSALTTGDLFGKEEWLSSVRSIHELMSRAILDTLERNGFDITSYKDDKGRLLVNAEKIEQLVIGERIENVTKSAAKDAKSGEDTAQESPTKRNAA